MSEDTPKRPREPATRLVEAEAEKPPREVLKRLAELLAIGGLLAGLVLSLGWSYAYSWFQAWKMPLASLDLGTDHLFEYGRLALVANSWIILLASAALIAVFWMIRAYGPRPTKATVPILMIAGLLLTWLGTHWMGSRAAQSDFKALSEGNFVLLPLAEVTLADEAAVPADFAGDIVPGRPCYRVIYTASDGLWLARTRDNNPDPLVAMIPRDQIVLVRLYPSQGNCPAGGG